MKRIRVMKKRAFTLVEMVMVIVILGITAMIGTDIITHMYKGYIRSKVVNKLQTRTEQILDIVSKRLAYRIKDTAVTSIDGVFSTYLKLSDTRITDNYNILEWVGYDNDSMIGEWDGIRFSGWSGYVDLDNPSTDKTHMVSSGSRLDKVKEDIFALSYDQLNFDDLNHGVGLVSKCTYDMDLTTYGFAGGSAENVFRIKRDSPSNTIFYVYNPNPSVTRTYCEQYYLTWSAYAIVPEGVKVITLDDGSITHDFNLTLKYNYRPWLGDTYKSPNVKSAVFAEHVSAFKFIQTGHTIRIKLCMRDPQSSFGFCKEKAVF